MAGAEKLLTKLPGKLGKDVRVVRAPCMGACDRAPVAAVGHLQTFKATPDKVAADGEGEHASARLEAGRRFRRLSEGRRLRAAEGLPVGQAHARRADQDRQRRRPARPRRRRLSHRPQMVAGARRAGAAPVRGQCRRGRARHLQGPLLSRARSAPLHRGHADRGLGGRGAGDLSLYPRRISRTAADAGRGNRQGRGGGPVAAHQAASAPRRRRLHLRRRVGDDRIDRGQARPAAPPPALRRAGRPVRPPDAGAERRDAVLGARHRREGRGLDDRARAATSARASAASRCPAG